MKLHSLLLASFLLTSPLSAASNDPPAPARAFMALRVKDADAAAAWYQRIFGMTLANRFSNENYEMRILDGERAIIELIQLKQQPMPAADPATLGYFKGGFTVDDFDATVARLQAAGVGLRGRIIFNAKLKLHVAAFSDADGNIIQILGRSAAPTQP